MASPLASLLVRTRFLLLGILGITAPWLSPFFQSHDWLTVQARDLRVSSEGVQRGNKNAASGQLNAFINQVQALNRSGWLSNEKAAALIALAQALIASL